MKQRAAVGGCVQLCAVVCGLRYRRAQSLLLLAWKRVPVYCLLAIISSLPDEATEGERERDPSISISVSGGGMCWLPIG